MVSVSYLLLETDVHSASLDQSKNRRLIQLDRDKRIGMSAKVLFPVTVVGSWSRPPWLIQALRRWQDGEINKEEFDKVRGRGCALGDQVPGGCRG